MKRFFLLLPVLAGSFWGVVGLFVRSLTAFGMNNYTILASRNLLAVLLFTLCIAIYRRSLLKIRLKDIWIFLGSGVLGMLAMNLCYNSAITRLNLSLAAILLSLAPIFVMFFAAFLFHERITLQKVGCMAMAIVGCILSSGILEQGDRLNLSLSGVAFGLCSAFFYSLYSIFCKIGAGRGYHALTVLLYSFLFNTMIASLFADWAQIGQFIAIAPLKNLAYMVMHALCAAVLPYILYNIALTYVDTGKVSILNSSSEPTAAMIFGLLFFSEIPTMLSFLGLIITITAIAILCRPDKDIPDRKASRTNAS